MLRALDTNEPEYGIFGSAYTDTWYSQKLWWMVFFIIPTWLLNWILFWSGLTVAPNYIGWLPHQVALTGFFLFVAFPQLAIVSHMRPVYFSDLMIKAKKYDDWVKSKQANHWMKNRHRDNSNLVHRYQVIFRWFITFISAGMLWILTLVALMRTGDFSLDAADDTQPIDWKVKIGILGGIASLYSTIIKYIGKGILFSMTFAREKTIKRLNANAHRQHTTMQIERFLETPAFRAARSVDVNMLYGQSKQAEVVQALRTVQTEGEARAKPQTARQGIGHALQTAPTNKPSVNVENGRALYRSHSNMY